ncbi:MAG: hypothetical protein ACLP22_02240, partial [Solirubrobacteraceae bacterium]
MSVAASSLARWSGLETPPQSTVVEPRGLLCNVYLHRLDRWWAEHGTGVLVRFADDLVVMCHSRVEAERALG